MMELLAVHATICERLSIAIVEMAVGDSMGELTLEEMLADPIVQAVMRSDGVRAEEVRAVVEEARRRLFPSGR
jgi:hypothetical protein